MTWDDAGAGGTNDGWQADAALLRTAFATLEAGVYLTDREGRIVAVNPGAERLLARPAADMIGENAHDLLHRTHGGARMPCSECPILAVMERGESASGHFEVFLDGEKHLMPVDWSSAPIRRGGQVHGAAVLFVDAGDRVSAERRQAAHLNELGELTERLTLLTEITTALTRTLDATEAIESLGRMVVPRLADWAALDLSTGPGEVRRVVAVPEGRSVDPALEGVLPAPPESSDAPLARVLRGEDALLLGPDDIDRSQDGTPLAAAQAGLCAALGATSLIIAPLRTPQRVFGAVTAARAAPRRPFGPADLVLVADIAHRAGLAVDNARRFGKQRDIATALQRHLLVPLPRTGRLAMAARYQPAPEGAEVGGDWYDAFLLPDGATALVIGDVLGHDLTAAAGMAQLRNMLRALAWDRQDPPSVVVGRLDGVMNAISDAPLASLVLARVEGPEHGPWQLHWTNAGHPPPLLITHDGRAGYLEATPDPLLGIQRPLRPPRGDTTAPLPPRSTLLLYTDGLVEIPGACLGSGLARLRRDAAELARHPLEDFCDRLLERTPPGGTDDIALLALRMPSAGEGAHPGGGSGAEAL